MAAYAAVVSLKHTINGLVNSSTVSSTREIIESAYDETVALQRALERSKDRARSSERLDGLEGLITDLARKLEDILEFYELNHLCSQAENDASLTLMPDVEDIREEIIFFAQTAKKIGEDYIEELSKPEPAGDAINSTTNTDFGVEMVGHSSKFEQIQEHLLDGMRPDDLCIFSIFGQKGSGITASATAVYEDLRNDGEKRFDRCAWVKVGKKPRLKKVLTSILEQVDDLAAWEYELLALREDEVVCQYLYDVLEHQRYMIMLEDVWNVEVVEYLENWLPDQVEGSIVFLTTSVKQVAESADNSYSFDQTGGKYMDEVFWGYVRAWFFGIEPIPPGFERVGRKIVRNCRGGAISFSKTLLFLIKSDKTLEQWTKIAADKRNSIFIIADEISEVRALFTTPIINHSIIFLLFELPSLVN